MKTPWERIGEGYREYLKRLGTVQMILTILRSTGRSGTTTTSRQLLGTASTIAIVRIWKMRGFPQKNSMEKR